MGRKFERLLEGIAASPPWAVLVRWATRHRHVTKTAASCLRIAWLKLTVPGIEVGFDSRVGPRCRVLCAEGASIRLRNVVLHRDVTLDADAGANIDIAADVSRSLSSSRSRVVIGPGSVIAAKERVVVGDGCGIADYVTIRDHDHDPSAGRLSELHYRTRPVVIGREVWIGSKAVVVAGVMIGDHAVVGAGAVVTRDVISGARVGGVPARPLGGSGHDEDGEGAGQAQRALRKAGRGGEAPGGVAPSQLRERPTGNGPER